MPLGYGYLTHHLPHRATHTRLSGSASRQVSPSARNEEETRYYTQIPRCSGLDSHNEQTPALKVPSPNKGGGGGEKKVCGFLFSGYSLRLWKPKQKVSSRVKNHRRSLFWVYKGPGKTRSTLCPNPPQNSNSKAKRPFLE
jgi:hypothetical protein